MLTDLLPACDLQIILTNCRWLALFADLQQPAFAPVGALAVEPGVSKGDLAVMRAIREISSGNHDCLRGGLRLILEQPREDPDNDRWTQAWVEAGALKVDTPPPPPLPIPLPPSMPTHLSSIIYGVSLVGRNHAGLAVGGTLKFCGWILKLCTLAYLYCWAEHP